jgi:hypothetical protein
LDFLTLSFLSYGTHEGRHSFLKEKFETCRENRRHKFLMIILAALSLGLVNKPVLKIELTGLKQIKLGEDFQASLVYKNSSGSQIVLLPSGASSSSMMRAPSTLIELRRKGEKKWTKLSAPPQCGNTNPITPEEFVTVDGYQAVSKQARFSWTADVVGKARFKAGTYEVQVSYDTSAPINNWIGGPLPEPAHSDAKAKIQSLFDKVPKGRFVTSPYTVQVR